MEKIIAFCTLEKYDTNLLRYICKKKYLPYYLSSSIVFAYIIVLYFLKVYSHIDVLLFRLFIFVLLLFFYFVTIREVHIREKNLFESFAKKNDKKIEIKFFEKHIYLCENGEYGIDEINIKYGRDLKIKEKKSFIILYYCDKCIAFYKKTLICDDVPKLINIIRSFQRINKQNK